MRNSYDDVKAFVLDYLVDHSMNVNAAVAKHFGITKQAVSQHLARMEDEQLISRSGPTRSRMCALLARDIVTRDVELSSKFQEDVVWREIEPFLPEHSANVDNILFYAATEMLNNANDHSEGSRVRIEVKGNPAEIRVILHDDGVGIFHKIKTACGLDDERQAVLELSKGKLTTAPHAHSGEGIFFTSRACDTFGLESGRLTLYCIGGEDWLFDAGDEIRGTRVTFTVRHSTKQTMNQVFDAYAADVDAGFSRTIVPVHLAAYGHENLISRSQAKRVLARFDRFREVILDFDGVNQIGQGFADEIFRVFSSAHPEIKLTPIRAKAAVKRMIAHVTAPNRPSST